MGWVSLKISLGQVGRLAVFAAASMFLAGAAMAQVQSAVPPVRSWVDVRGVDAMTGEVRLSATEVSIGQPGNGGLVFGRDWISSSWRDSLAGTISSSSSTYTVSLGGRSETFTYSGGVFSTDQHIGSSLDLTSGKFTYTLADGTLAEFDTGAVSCSGVTAFWACNQATITKLTRPDGEIITWTYATGSYGGGTGLRPQSISNNLGYQIHFTYDSGDFLSRTRVTGINRAYYYCADTATSCDPDGGSKEWPYVDYSTSGSTEIVTDRLGNASRYLFSSGKLTGYRKPSESGANFITIDYLNAGANAGKVNWVLSDFLYSYWYYDYSDASGVRTTTISSAIDGVTKVLSNISSEIVTEVWADDSGTRKTTYDYDGYQRRYKTTGPDDDYVELTLDSRGNVTQSTHGKTGSGLAAITVSATYPSCTGSNTKTCNKPDTTTSAAGYTTNYEYSTTHGGLTKVTLPEPLSGLDQPETRFTYAAKHAHFKNSGGSVVEESTSVYRLTETSACQTGEVSSSCVGSANETHVVFTYGSATTSVPNNLLATVVLTEAGNSSISSSVTAAYTAQGDVETIEDPLTNVTSFFYDAGRRLRATVTPDPGAGLDPRVTRISYDADSNPVTIDHGYVSSPASWDSLTVLESQSNTVGGWSGKLISSKLSVGGTTFARTDYDYDYEKRPACVVTRMNPSELTSLDDGYGCGDVYGGSYGPDRITAFGYDVYGAAEIVQSGYGVSGVSPRTDRARAFTTGGAVETLTDALSHKTTFIHDDYGRVTETDYPDKSSPGDSDSSDNTQVTYDSYGRMNGTRDRDSKWTNYCYDHLDRVIKQKYTGSSTADTTCSSPDITFEYDNFSRLTSVTKGSHVVSYAYDALGRLSSETQAGKTVGYSYNAAGWRTRMTWPDSFYVDYVYDGVGELTEIREEGQTSGAAHTAVYTYDNLGRRISLTRGNGGTTSYGYDGGTEGTWLTDLDLDLGGSSYDVQTDLAHNPAGQIVSKTVSNSNYNFSLPSDFINNYSINGQNQYTSVDANSISYDARENLDSIASGSLGSYLYDQSSRLTRTPASGSQVAALTYDPTGRLYEVAGSSTRQYIYDGNDIIAEYNGSTLLNRYVHGPGIDEPIVWFYGSGYYGSGSPDRRWLYADERGSIVAVEGSSTTVNTYDDYGVPGSGNVGLFQYTGQIWIPELGLYHYKARAYHAAFGRFMQADPIGYDGGINLYAYVGADPINLRDPLGLQQQGPGGCLPSGEGGEPVDGEGNACTEIHADCSNATYYLLHIDRCRAISDINPCEEAIWYSWGDEQHPWDQVCGELTSRKNDLNGVAAASAGSVVAIGAITAIPTIVEIISPRFVVSPDLRDAYILSRATPEVASALERQLKILRALQSVADRFDGVDPVVEPSTPGGYAAEVMRAILGLLGEQ